MVLFGRRRTEFLKESIVELIGVRWGLNKERIKINDMNNSTYILGNNLLEEQIALVDVLSSRSDGLTLVDKGSEVLYILFFNINDTFSLEIGVLEDLESHGFIRIGRHTSH